MSVRFWMNYLCVAVLTVMWTGLVGDSNHREIFAQKLSADMGTDNGDAVYFSAVGLANQTLVIFPADNSPVHCDSIADYLAFGDGAPGLVREGFTAVECDGHKETINGSSTDSERGGIQGAPNAQRGAVGQAESRHDTEEADLSEPRR